MRIRRMFYLLLSALLTVASLSGCDKLDDGDATADVLPGNWAFSYTTAEPLGMELTYRLVIFNADGTCALTYDGGQLDGTYRASRDVIRIVTVVDGEETTLLWRVQQMSAYRITATSNYELSNGREVTMTVVLDRL